MRVGSWRKAGPFFRCLIFLWLASITLTQTGCQVFRKFGARPEPVPVIFEQSPTQNQLILALNAQAGRVDQLQSSISLAADGMPKLKGTIQMERPDRIRLKAGLMGVSELGVDVGSNSEMFWVWMKAALPGQSPAIYFARHRDYIVSPRRAALPLEPRWILDAVGLVEFTDSDLIQGPLPGPGAMVTIISVRQSPTGPVTRRTVVDPRTARIYQQAFYDSSNRRIAYSNSSDYRQYAEHQVSLPHRIELHVFDANQRETKLIVEANEYKINSLFGDPDKMWTKPNAEGVPLVNLAQLDGLPPQ